MGKKEYMDFQKKLAFHSAPALLGVKSANLISLKNSEFDLDSHIKIFRARVKGTGLNIKLLCSCENSSLILLYNEKLLSESLKRPYVKNFLVSCGYNDNENIDTHLETLSSRISCSPEFPHEIGIFLDYPFEDIIGFIRNKGRNFKMCGYWKVYSDTEYANRTFTYYDKCREFLCYKLNCGCDIYQAIKNPQEVFSI